MFELSPENADRLLGISNYGLILSALILVFASLGSFWANSVLSRYTNLAIAEANTSAKAADARAEEARLNSAKANLEAAKASERAAILENQTAELTKQAEEAKAEAAKVNERIHKLQSVRRLSNDQASALKEFFSSDKFRYLPGASLQIFSVPDSESQMYAMDFIQVFRESGVNFYPTPMGKFPNECVQTAPDEYGVALVINSLEIKKETQRWAHLSHVLPGIGIEVSVQLDPERKDHEAGLYILKKPMVS